MRIVNWNVERPAIGSRKNAKRVEYLLGLSPDLVILTETSTAVDLGSDFTSVFTRPSPRKPRDGEAVAAIWIRDDRFHLTSEISTSDPREAICVDLSFDGVPFLVYGSILPYHGYRGPDGTSPRWHEHKRAIEWHRSDWQRLRKAFPHHRVIAGGDYNQCRDGIGRYGTVETRQLLTSALTDAGLECVTEADFVAASGLSRRNIDHVCLSRELSDAVVNVWAWEGTQDGVRLSDHNGITVDLDDTKLVT